MAKKGTTGMSIGYRKYAIAASLLLAVGLLLPMAHIADKDYNIFSLIGIPGAVIYMIMFIATVGVLLLDVWLIVKPSKFAAMVTSGVAAIPTIMLSISLFASKMIFDKSGVFESKFMVSDFSIGYWIALVASYVTLFCAMKTAKIHPGYIVLVILSIIWLFPILWIVLTALREESGYYVGYFFPKGLTLNNFIELFSDTSLIHFGKWWMNTLIVASCNCVFSTMIVLMTAYVLSRTRFKNRLTLMKGMLIIGMFPGFMSMVAVYNILKGLGIAQTLGALILVNAAGAAMGYYIVKGFFDTIPKSLDEAALLDGATKWQVFTRVTIPMSKSVIIYTVLTSFMGPWGDYIFPSMMLGDNQAQYTVALGLNWLTDFRRIDKYYTQFAAGALLVSLPIVILFIALQRFYVEGMSGAVKG